MKEQKRDILALGLFSGGLDSILACKVIAAQGIRVKALKFVTPFFDHALLAREEEYRATVLKKYGIEVCLVDLSAGYLSLLRSPQHGFGKNFNPCVDCKIFMIQRARELLAEFGASFLITGEVLGQRPMSQRRDTLQVIARDSAAADILVRPLSAKLLPETKPEREGLVERARLYGFSGRGRKQQMELAQQFGLEDYPSPAGGCILTDPNLAPRIARLYRGELPIGSDELHVSDVKLLLVGRQFQLPGGAWVILGRTQVENEIIENLRQPGDWLLWMPQRPGPLTMIRHAGCSAQAQSVVQQAAALTVRYGKKKEGRVVTPAEVCVDSGSQQEIVVAEAISEEELRAWQF